MSEKQVNDYEPLKTPHGNKKFVGNIAPLKNIEITGEKIIHNFGLPFVSKQISFAILLIAVMILIYLYYRAISFDVNNREAIRELQDYIYQLDNHSPDAIKRKFVKRLILEDDMMDRMKVSKTYQITTAAVEGLFIGFLAGTMTGNVNSIILSSITWFFVQGISNGLKLNYDYDDIVNNQHYDDAVLALLLKPFIKLNHAIQSGFSK